jgi:hypothetical protein
MRILGVVSSSSREVPNAPTIGTATDVGTGRAYNNGAATVTFTAPTFDGGLPITGYTVTSSPGGFTGTGSASPITVAGLQSNTAYTFTVVATNSRGNSTASAASNSITATTVPQAPTIGTATAGNASATVTFTGNATGGKAISTYTATSSPGSITGSSATSPITVSGLTNGTAYTFTVTATNANGTSTASAASNSVTPAVPTSYDSIASFTPSGTATVTFSSIPQTYKHLQIRFSGIMDGDVWIRYNGIASNYTRHHFYGNGSGPLTVDSLLSQTVGTFTILGNASYPTVGILDIHDYASTTKIKTHFAFSGTLTSSNSAFQSVTLASGMYTAATSAITSLSIIGSSNFTAGTTISLYGIQG